MVIAIIAILIGLLIPAVQKVRNAAAAAVTVALCFLVVGCGDGRLKTRGKVVKDGQPLVPQENESVRVTFVPILPDGKPPSDHYFADYNPADGTFESWGKDRHGIPPLKIPGGRRLPAEQAGPARQQVRREPVAVRVRRGCRDEGNRD